MVAQRRGEALRRTPLWHMGSRARCFCLSKARRPPPLKDIEVVEDARVAHSTARWAGKDDDDASVGATQIRADLAQFRLKALKKRAVAEGVDAAAVENALDEDIPKAALIDLIVAAAHDSKQ